MSLRGEVKLKDDTNMKLKNKHVYKH